MTTDEQINLDNLIYFLESKKRIHIKLLRTDHNGKHIFLNGILIVRLSDRLFLLKERILGEIRVSLAEIKPNGIREYHN